MHQDLKDYIMQHSAGNIYWKDLNGRYLGCNEQYAEVLGLSSPQALVGLNDDDLLKCRQWVTEHDIQALIEVDQHIMRAGVTQILEEQGLNQQGGKATYLTIKQPLKDEKGDIISLMGTSIDISLAKKEAQLRRQQEATAFFLSTCHSHQVIQKLKVMAGSLSHEIKTPMAGVRIGLELMKNFFEQSKKDKNQITVERLEEHEQRVNRMIQRISAGTALVDMQLKNMLVENIDTSQFQMSSARQCIQEAIHTFPFDDPAAVNKVHVSIQKEFDFLGDPLLTKHVLWNLLNNALYFMKEMGRGDIFISTDEKEGQHVIHFKDTAKGMPPEQAERVFEPFYTNRFDGSGLGLSFCLMVIQAYGGTITCQSVEGEYAEFSLLFPKLSVTNITDNQLCDS